MAKYSGQINAKCLKFMGKKKWTRNNENKMKNTK